MANYNAGALNNMSGMSSGINPVTLILDKLQCDFPPSGVQPDLYIEKSVLQACNWPVLGMKHLFGSPC